jgi:uncharacterized coiled-coil DUF342 family protein
MTYFLIKLTSAVLV